MLKILALIGAWVFFYSILKARNKKIPGIKATVITLLFASLIFRLSYDLYARVDRAWFALKKQGEVQLSLSPLKIPPNQAQSYCNQFTDQNNNIIQQISERGDGKYCGQFWKFEKDKNLLLPYKIINSNQILYWASPSLKIIGSKQGLEQALIQNKR
ncbi:MAG: hypothetical protein H0T84_02195 [Tatlockia sp.]|nr:hypothetical protein [Tatlockia sp.]